MIKENKFYKYSRLNVNRILFKQILTSFIFHFVSRCYNTLWNKLQEWIKIFIFSCNLWKLTKL